MMSPLAALFLLPVLLTPLAPQAETISSGVPPGAYVHHQTGLSFGETLGGTERLGVVDYERERPGEGVGIDYADIPRGIVGSVYVYRGFSIGNSEVGLSSLTIAGFVLRLVCTNGLIAREKMAEFSRRHVSEDLLDHFPKVLANATSNVDAQRRRLTFSLESPVRDPAVTLRSFSKQFQLATEEQEAVDWAWPQEEGPTMFHVVNTFTRAAQHPSLVADSAYRLQRVGGTILSMVEEGGTAHA